jgi:DNA polymerase-4
MAPDLVIVPPDFDRYGAESRAIRAVFDGVTDVVEPLALDEAFLDVSGARRRLGDGPAVAALIRQRIHEERHLSASVGVAAVKFLAKIASRKAKPDGLLVIADGSELAFLHPLPVSDLWGVGRKTADALSALGISTVGQLADTPRDTLERRLGHAAGGHLHELAWARDPRPVETDVARKSVSAERTFDTDLVDPAAIHREWLRLGDEVAARLRGAGVAGRTIAIKVRTSDFETLTRARTLDLPTDVAADIVTVARALYAALGWRTPRVRLLGIGMSQLVDGAGQAQLSLEGTDWRAVEVVQDAVRRRFGPDALERARLQQPKDEA